MSKKSEVIKDERDAEKAYRDEEIEEIKREQEKKKEEERLKNEPPVKAPGTTGPRYPER